MDWKQRAKMMRVAFAIALLGAVLGVAIPFIFDWWNLFFGPGGLSLPPGTYPKIVLLALGALALVAPVAVGMAIGAGLGGLLGLAVGYATARRPPTT